MKNPRNTNAVSQIVSEIILLSIAVIAVSIIYTQVLAAPGPQDIANVTIVGKIEDGHPVFNLQRGESLDRDTKIYINIAGGYNKNIYTLDQLFIQNYIGNHLWNIGEPIILPTENVTGYGGPQVEGTIVDTKTNAIVFWGILQEGIITGHKGGIWHFDEKNWNINVTNEVKDSSGNKNHGIAKNDARIVNRTVEPTNVVHNNSGYFNVLRDAYVRVPSSWSLNISNEITVEAWMKPQLLPPILDIVDLEEKFGYTPYIIHVDGECYAIVSEDQSKRGTIQTVLIDSEGGIINRSVDYYGNAQGSILLRPMITKMTSSMYLVAFNSKMGGNLYMHLRTYNISSDGSIEYTGNELTFLDYSSSANEPNRPSLQKIAESIYAIAYWVPSYGGILKTVAISSTGAFDTSSVKMIRYDTSVGYEPCLINVTKNITALAYRGASNQGILKIFNISSTGDITYTGITTTFEQESGYEPCLIKVSGTIYAVAYRNTVNNGIVKTYTILPDGSIAWTGNIMTFEDTVPCYDPCLIHAEADFYVVAYSTGNSGSTTGYIIALKIENDGSIQSQSESRREFKVNGRDRCYNPIILHIEEHLFAISFTGPTDHPGELITINIGIDTYPPHRGITKQDSFGIFANTTTVVGSINNIMVSAPISTGWHHFALTYDGSYIRLYVDGSWVGQTPYLNHLINKTSADLLFGRNYHGYIDEIAIYDHALTQTQIQNHINKPGTFETYT
jgi:hypothetical protein